MPENMKPYLDKFIEFLTEHGTEFLLGAIGAVLIFFVGRIIARMIQKAVRRAMGKAKVDETLIAFVANITYAFLLVLIILVALNTMGVQVTSFIAILGAAGLAVGLALQGSLSNFAAGVLLIIFRPFKAGDVVDVNGVLGKVEEIDIFTTKLATPDNKCVIIPNSKITDGNIVNLTRKEMRRVDMTIGVAYDADLKRVKDVLTDVLAQDARVLKDPAPTVGVIEFGDSSINLVVRPWVKPDDYWDVLFDTNHAIKDRFDAEDITIPFPQRDVHLFKGDAPAAD